MNLEGRRADEGMLTSRYAFVHEAGEAPDVAGWREVATSEHLQGTPGGHGLEDVAVSTAHQQLLLHLGPHVKAGHFAHLRLGHQDVGAPDDLVNIAAFREVLQPGCDAPQHVHYLHGGELGGVVAQKGIERTHVCQLRHHQGRAF